MEFENTVDYLETLSMEELIKLYVKSGHSSNGFDKELINLVKIEHDFLYSKSSVEYLDSAQLKHLHKQIGAVILNNLSEEYENHVEKEHSTLYNSITYGLSKRWSFINIESISITHNNCYEAEIKDAEIEYVYDDEKVFAVCLKKNYEYRDCGLPIWECVRPFDKDEIVIIELNYYDGDTESIRIPYRNISTSGSYNVNAHSYEYEDDEFVLIEWIK